MVEGESLFALERYGDSAGRFATLIRDHSGHESADAALYKLGWSLTKLDRHEEARTAFQQLSKQYPESEFTPESKKLAAQSLVALGRSDEAARELSSVARDSSETGHDARLELARLQRDREEYAAAVDAYEELARKTKDPAMRARARYEQAEVLYKVGETDRAIKSALRCGTRRIRGSSSPHATAWPGRSTTAASRVKRPRKAMSFSRAASSMRI